MKLTNNLFKKVARPIVRQTKEVIAEELVSPKPEMVEKKESAEVQIVENDLTREDKVMLGVLAVGLVAVFLLTRRPSVKVYVVK